MDDTRLTELYERGRANDPAALETLMKEAMPEIFSLLCGLTRDPGTAEELSQDVAERICRSIQHFTPGTRFSAWATTIAMNRFRDWRRRRKTANKATLVTDKVAAQKPGEKTTYGRALWLAVTRLPESEREVFCLRHIADLPFKRIAAILHKPLGTVLSLQHRALKTLARKIKR